MTGRLGFQTIFLVACTFVLGCGGGDPTTKFKSIVDRATKKMEADQALNTKYKLESPAFDVKKTDSTVSPFVAQVSINATDKEKAAEAVPSDPDPEQRERLRYLHDFGDRTFVFVYAFQDGKWTLKESATQTSSTGVDAIMAKQFGPPSEIVGFFTP